MSDDDNVRRFPGSLVRGGPPRGGGPPRPPGPPSEEEQRKQYEALQDRIEKGERIKLARDLLMAGRVSTIDEAFKLADAFADEALRRLPHEPFDARLTAGVGHF